MRANGLVLEPSGHARHRLGRPSISPIIPNTEAFFSGWTYLNGRASCVLKVKATRIILAHTVNGTSLERKLLLLELECLGFQPCNISEECRKVQVFRGTPPRGISPVEVFCRNRMSARFLMGTFAQPGVSDEGNEILDAFCSRPARRGVDRFRRKRGDGKRQRARTPGAATDGST